MNWARVSIDDAADILSSESTKEVKLDTNTSLHIEGDVLMFEFRDVPVYLKASVGTAN